MHIKKKLYIVDSVETNNFNDPLIMQKIGGLWNKPMATLPKESLKYGIYHDYESDFLGNYTISVATDADNGNVPLEFSGKYMVFDVDVKIENPILESWKKIWSMSLDRAYTFDFEQYNLDGTIQIYIALKTTKAESMVTRFKAVFFDMDGIVVDSMPYHFISWFEALRKYDVHLSPMLVFQMEGAKWAEIVKPAFIQSSKKLTPEIINAIPSEREKLLKKYFKRYIFDGIPEFIKLLKNQDVFVGLVTGSYYREAQKILPKELFDSFDTIITGDSVKNGKPDPEPYLTAAKNLKVDPKECLVIENAPFGVKSAKAAEMTCYAVATSLSKEYLCQADKIFETHEGLYKKVCTINNVKKYFVDIEGI